mmetsp:Transcript_16833/g.53945  ORF Transcript_16833/g.53945 Transcript_16833/m.53945 type:complete len:220 (+) Transcript_16833:36-695(+)
MLFAPIIAAFAFHAPSPLRAPARAPASAMLLPRDAGQKAAGLALAAIVAFAPLSEVEAARSGGRVGGRAPSRAPSVSRAAPAPASPSRTNVYISPAPVYGGGMGYGYGGYGGYGGFGGGGISTGTYLGISLVETLIREQQRQAYLQQQLRTQQELGRDQAAIAQLQAELAAQNSKVEQLKSQQVAPAAAAPAADAATVSQLQQQLQQQQQQIEALKAAK